MAAEHLQIVQKKWPWDAAVCSELGNAAAYALFDRLTQPADRAADDNSGASGSVR